MKMGRARYLVPTEHDIALENPRILNNDRYADSLLFAGCDSSGNKIVLYLFRKSTIVQTNVYLQTSLGIEYNKSDTNLQESNDWCTISAKLECCEPMNTWRISYNGAARRIGSRELDHMKVNLLWHPTSSPVYYDRNRNLNFTTHKRLLLKNEFIFKLQKGYEQWGSFHGLIQINTQEPTEINLHGLKKRFWSSGTKDFVSLILFSDTLLTSITSSINRRTGHTRTLKKHEIIEECDLKYPFQIPAEISYQFSNHKDWYKMNTRIRHPSLVNFDSVQIYGIENNVDGNKEIKLIEGFLLSFKKLKRRAPIYIPRIFPSLAVNHECIVELNDTDCWNSVLVGGKASSLSKIKYFFTKVCNDETLFNLVRLPKSIFLTVNAMDYYIRHNNSLKNLMKMLEYGIYEIPKSQLPSFSYRLQREWESCEISSELVSSLLSKIDLKKRYAIRSSGVYEDTCDFSAAGQHSSFLNVTGVLDILEAVKLCWASAYSVEALQYRRNHGLPLIIKLGVIIQEMIDVDLYGVLFTCHPSTNDPRTVSIDINSCSPKFFQNEILGLENPVIVNKQDMKIQFSSSCSVISSNSDQDSTSDDDNQSEISTRRSFRELFLKLSEVCLKFESIFSQIVNVEWGFIDEKIYIFQTRPVTTIFTWSDFEISHELDSGFNKFDAITFHNYGEILCDANSPLSITFVNRIMEQAFNFNRKNFENSYHKKLFAVSQFHIGINVCNGILVQIFPEIPFFQRLIEMVMCGQLIVTEELYELAKKRNGLTSSWSIFCTVVYIFKLFMQNDRYSQRAEEMAENFKIDAKKYSCAESLFDIIIESAESLLKITEYHFKVSNTCNILKCITLWFMAVGDEKDLQKHVFNLSFKLEDVKTMSSELPALLKEIASLIEKYDKEKEYPNMSLTEKLRWIHENCPQVQSKMKYLMRTFGFRCIKEMDLMTETWSINPTPIFENIDTLIGRKDRLGNPSTTTEPPNRICNRRYGKIVNYLVARTKHSVANRERTKKSMVKALHQFRLAFRHLGNLLAQDAAIPSAKLVFYYTMSELKQIIEHDNKRTILHKGYRRYRSWNNLESLKFNDVIVGLPRPIKKTYTRTCVLKGIPISCHCIVGKAYLLSGTNSNHVKNISPGDIVVTRNIDLGWSLYFPIIAGIVTELGGLMSHGAIAARECGLPCIVGVKNATCYFETGDIISINGMDGIVSKLL